MTDKLYNIRREDGAIVASVHDSTTMQVVQLHMIVWNKEIQACDTAEAVAAMIDDRWAEARAELVHRCQEKRKQHTE